MNNFCRYCDEMLGLNGDSWHGEFCSEDCEGAYMRGLKEPEPPEDCHCRSYFRRTRQHVPDCPCHGKEDIIETRFEILDL
jgi:hypothetical protein